MISDDVLKRVLARPLPTVAERADRLLLEAVRGQDRLGSEFDITEPRFIAATYSQDADEVCFLSRMLSDQGLMQGISIGGRSEVLPQGYVAANELTRRVARSDKGFVAMWFNKELTLAYKDGFKVGVSNAGYDPVRVGGLVNRCVKTSGGFLLRGLVDQDSIDIFGALVDVFHQLRCLQTAESFLRHQQHLPDHRLGVFHFL